LLIFKSFTAHHLSKNNWLRGIIFILLIRESIFVGWCYNFNSAGVPRYKLSLCYNFIKPDLLGFLGIGVFACGLTACSRGSHQICSLCLLPHNLLSFGSLGTEINKSKSAAFAVQSNYNS
jgi:hypothetical protein